MLKDEELIDVLGKPDSIIVDNDWECGNYVDVEETVRVLYYGKTKFISSNGISLLYILNLEEDRFTFDFMKEQLKFGSTKSELAKIFPGALSSLNEQLQAYNKAGRMKVFMRQTPDHEESSGWIMTFNGDQLKEIELWWFIC